MQYDIHNLHDDIEPALRVFEFATSLHKRLAGYPEYETLGLFLQREIERALSDALAPDIYDLCEFIVASIAAHPDLVR